MKHYLPDFVEGVLLAGALFFAIVAASSFISSVYAQGTTKEPNDQLCILRVKSCYDNGCRKSSREATAKKCVGVYTVEGMLEACNCQVVGS